MFFDVAPFRWPLLRPADLLLFIMMRFQKHGNKRTLTCWDCSRGCVNFSSSGIKVSKNSLVGFTAATAPMCPDATIRTSTSKTTDSSIPSDAKFLRKNDISVCNIMKQFYLCPWHLGERRTFQGIPREMCSFYASRGKDIFVSEGRQGK